MSKTLNTKQNEDGNFSVVSCENYNEIETHNNFGRELIAQLKTIENEFVVSTANLNQATRNIENGIQRYNNAENNRQWIYNNEVNKYNDLVGKQNSLLNRINFPEIKLWRFQDLLYFRTYNNQLIINNQVEIQKEISSRYGTDDVRIINDINDALRNDNQYKVNTIFIAINNIIVIEQEIFDINQSFEIFETYNSGWKRNLLAYTRYSKKGIIR